MRLTGFLIAILSFITITSSAQSKELKFSQLEGVNGISIGKINSFAEDEDGFLWLSDQTNRCILRYDGSQLTRYAYDPDADFSLGGFYPETLFADTAGILWIGYYGQGLDRFNTRTNEITHWENNPNDSNSLPDNSVTAIIRDHLGKIWVATYGGLSMLDEETGIFTTYSHDENDPKSLSHNWIRALYEDKQGTIWVGSGFAFNPDDGGGFNRFNRETKDFTRFLHDPNDPESIINEKVRAIFEDNRGNFWVGSSGDGLHTLDRKTGKFTRYRYDPKNPAALSRGPVKNPSDHITFITEDSENHLWIGTEDNGLIRYNPSTGKTRHFGIGAETESGFDQRSGWAVHTLNSGLLYFSTQSARLYKIDLKNYKIPNYEEIPSATCFLQPNEHELWIGNINGVHRKNLNTGRVTSYVPNDNDPNSLSNRIVNSMFEDSNGSIWVSTFGGLNKYLPETDNFKVYVQNPDDPHALASFDIARMAEAQDGSLWIGSFGGGLNKYDPTTDRFTNYQEDPSDLSALSANWPVTLLMENAEHLLIGMRANDGLNRMNINTGKVERFIPGITVSDIYRDSQNKIWIGTANGLYHQNDDGAYVPYKNEILNKGITGHIRSIIEDENQNLWFGTNLGLLRVDADRREMILYNQENGLQGDNQGHLGNAFKRHDGLLYFISNTGYYSFQPSSFERIEDKSEIVFTDFWLGNEAIYFGDHKALNNMPLSQASQINLKHNQNVFGIGFSQIDYRNSGESSIQYQLENYDAGWRNAFLGERLNYFKVPPGNYIFRIKALNTTNGTWAEKSIDIFIAKPWWAQWWAYILYALILGIGVWRVHLYQRSRLLRLERERNQQKELEHAKEIQKAYTDLKNTQTQLIQSEKMASLGELTAGIAHEIQNPLNFVNNFSEVNTELLAELKEEIKQKNYEEVESIAESLKENEQKILHHGKRAGAIVKSMLQHSRSRQGEREEVDLNMLVDEYLRLAYHGMRAKDKSFNADMETDFDKDLGKLKLVPQDIGRVILNLITNAFYAVHQKKQKSNGVYKPVVTVKTKQENGKVELEVADNGTGMSEEVAQKIFQPFFTTKPTGEGTGLGLSLSYDIIKAHGGNLSVDSKIGEGSKFIIELPAK